MLRRVRYQVEQAIGIVGLLLIAGGFFLTVYLVARGLIGLVV